MKLCRAVMKGGLEKLKILSTHSITYYHLLMCPIAKWFYCGLHIHISLHFISKATHYGCEFVPYCISNKS